MHNLSHHFHHHYKTAHGFIVKHKHHAHHFIFAGVAIVLGIFLYNKFVLAVCPPNSQCITWPIGLPLNNKVSLDTVVRLTNAPSVPAVNMGIYDGIVVSPDGKNLYTSATTGNGEGTIFQYSRDVSTGSILPLAIPSLSGAMSYTMTISKDGRSVYVPSVYNGNIYQYTRNITTGNLSPMSPAFVTAGSDSSGLVTISPDGNFAYVASFSNGNIYQYRRDTITGALSPLSNQIVVSGTQEPFSLDISPDGKFAYLSTLDAGVILEYTRNITTGELAPLSGQTSIASGQGGYALIISPNGKFVYVTSGEGYIYQYNRNLVTGRLDPMTVPRVSAGSPFGMAISPDGSELFVANIAYGGVSDYACDKNTGSLKLIKGFPSGLYPYGVAISPDVGSVYVPNQNPGDIKHFRHAIIGTGQVLSPGLQAGTNSSTAIVYNNNGSAGIALSPIGQLSTMNLPSVSTNGILSPKGAISSDGISVYSVGLDNSSTPYIQQYTRNSSTGYLDLVNTVNVTVPYSVNGSSMVISPDGKSVYVKLENQSTSDNFIYQYSRDIVTGDITPIASEVSAGFGYGNSSENSSEIFISSDGKTLYTIGADGNSYGSVQNIYQYNRDLNTGELTLANTIATDISIGSGVDTKSITVSPDGNFLYLVTQNDYNGNNSSNIYQYSRDSNTGNITPLTTPTISIGSFVTEVVISPDNSSMYVISEDYSNSSIYQYSRNISTGEISPLSTATIYSGDFPQGLNISPDGKTLYVSNVYTNQISSYARDLVTGELSSMGTVDTGSHPSMILTSNDNSSTYVFSFDGRIDQFNRNNVLPSFGTFTSAYTDIGSGSFTDLSWIETLNGQTITMKARSSDTSDFSGSPDWSTCSNINNGDALSTGGCVTSGHRYIQYQATLVTTDVNVSPVLESVSVGFTQYGDLNGEGEVISPVYDSGVSNNIITNMRWEESNTSQTEIVKFQVRSASTSEDLASSPWCGPSLVCDGNSYFTDSLGSTELDSNHPLRTGNDDRFFQYRIVLNSSGAVTPIVTSATVVYVANSAPDFDPTYGTNGVLVSQAGATSSDPGIVSISYRVRDVDTSEGTVSPGYIKPSFQYNAGSGWVSIDSLALATGDTDNKAVQANDYTTYTAMWAASTTIEGLFSSNVQIRVIADDNEAANNQGVVDSPSFTLDTKAPLVTTTFDSSVSTTTENVILTASDNNQFRYRLCNDPLFPATDAQNNSCAWTEFSGDVNQVAIPWMPIGSPNNEIVNLEVQDSYGNVNVRSVIAPAMPADFSEADLSQPINNSFVEFLSWSMFQDIPSSTFASYKLYHSVDGENYTLLTNITDPNLNYYRHEISVASSSLTHYYKVLTTNTEGGISNFTQVISDIPDGVSQGSTDNSPAEISNIAVPSQFIKSNQAKVTFTTNKLSKAIVHYHVSGNQGWYTASSTSYLLANQNVNLSGLLPNTTYNTEVATMNIAGTISAFVAGPDFTTNSGPVISNVVSTAITANSATIQWNTSTSSDSYVYYSANQAFTNPLTVGSATKVTCAQNGVCAHSVVIPSLTTGHTYYYYVKSTDAAGDTVVDDHNSAYYYFVTTVDTVAPVISSVSTPVVSSVSAVAVWKTSEPATSQIKWGTTSGNLDHTTVLDNTKSIYHVVTLSKDTYDTGSLAQTLTPSTSYFYKVFSSDSAGNEASSTEQTFTTTATGKVNVVTQYVSSGGGRSAAPAATVSKNTNTSVKDKLPPVIFNIRATDVGVFNADIKITTNEDIGAFVSYGETKTYGSTEGDPNWSTDKTIHLKKLQAGTTYHYVVKVSDKAGNQTVSEDKTFTTLPVSQISAAAGTSFFVNDVNIQNKIEKIIESALPSLSPPFVSTPTVHKDKITENSAVVTWQTNIKALGSIKYSTDDEYTATSSYALETPTNEEKKTKHAVVLTGLKPNTKYHLQANSYVFPQVVGKSQDVTFTTSAAKIRATIVDRNKEGFTVAWTTDEPTSSFVEYTNIKSGVSRTITDDNKKTYHSVKVSNLTPDTRFGVKVSGINLIGNTVEAADTITAFTSSDIIPPTISNFKIDNALVPGKNDSIQTVIGWQTSEIANSTVYYEEGVGSSDNKDGKLANKVETPDDYTLNHTMILANLKPGTVYRVSVVSSDPSGNIKTFGPNTVITPKQTESVLDLIFKNFEDTFKFLRTSGQ